MVLDKNYCKQIARQTHEIVSTFSVYDIHTCTPHASVHTHTVDKCVCTSMYICKYNDKQKHWYHKLRKSK